MIFLRKPSFIKVAAHGRRTAGFTLVELMVTLTIMVLATGLVMVKYVSFNSTVLLNSLAYQIAFDFRETQSLAISVRGSGGEFREEYGLHFDMSDTNQYLLFQDSNQSTRDGGTIRYEEGEEIGDPIIVDPRFTIMDICVTPAIGGPESCHTSDGGVPEFVTIAFARPDFDAVMYGEGVGTLRSVRIVVGAGDDSSDITRSVIVTSNGQITVQ